MESSNTATAAEKTAEELRREIEELDRQQREINDRIRDPRGLRRGGLAAHGNTNGPPRNFGVNGGTAIRQRGFIRPAERSEDQPAPKRRLSSAVVKVKEDGEVTEDGSDGVQDVKEKQSTTTAAGDANGNNIAGDNDKKPSHLLQRRGGFLRRDGGRRAYRMDDDIPSKDIPRVLPKDNDPSLVSRNKRMLGSLLGTLEKFQKEDMHLSATEAYMRRSTSLQRAEERAREESEKLRQQEREKIAENRRRDLTLRARVAAKAEEKKLELLFIQWSEHQKLLGNYLRTKAEPPIYYLPVKPLDEDETVAAQRKEQVFLEWKAKRREELTEYQKKTGEQYLANVETELERWQNRNNNTRRGNNNNNINLQETMDKELETHQLEHGPKTRKIPGGNNEDEDDVEDINVGEDDIMDDVLVVDDDNNRRGEARTG